MREMVVDKKSDGFRLDQFLEEALPGLPYDELRKYIRSKRIKCNRKRCRAGQKVFQGDVLQLYIPEDALNAAESEQHFLQSVKPDFSIVYEDENLILADKKPGMLVQEENAPNRNTLLGHIRAYLYQKGEWNPDDEKSFVPVLCNRIDQNTGGIVIAAKNAATFGILNEKIKNQEITKKYLCITVGQVKPAAGQLKYFLLKNSRKKRVDVFLNPVPDGRTAVTNYRTLASEGGLNLVEAALITGRTHQIRASFAKAGFPLLGDDKYGRWDLNQQYGETKQALYSYMIRFDFTGYSGHLEYLQGKSFQAERIPFIEKYFPNYK